MTRSILETDAYKFSMQDAGWPLRTETFVCFFRKGGPQIVPFDLEACLTDMRPRAVQGDYDYLAANEYEMGCGFKSLFADKSPRSCRITALPKWSIFYPGEPLFTVTGPSAFVSWFEPLALQLSLEIQIATLALRDKEALAEEVRTVTCEEHRDIVLAILDRVKVRAPQITVDDGNYFARVKKAALDLIEVVGDPARVFDVGLRSAICPQQHEIALGALYEAGIMRTSNVAGAKALGLKPVGTMGHEHPQRFRQDELAFRAVKERRPFKSSFLTDTFSSFQSGIPAALRIIAEDPHAHDSMRYDSEDKRGDYIFAVSSAKQMGLDPAHIIESELDLEETAKFEELRKALEVAPERQFYGYGKYFVSDTAFSKLTRDRVSAVYKLSQTGPWPTMKFSRHKESLPGRPVLFRRTSGSGPAGIIGQEGEACPQGYALVSGTRHGERLELDTDMARQLELCQRQDGAYAVWSPATNALRDRVKRDIDRTMNESRLESL